MCRSEEARIPSEVEEVHIQGILRRQIVEKLGERPPTVKMLGAQQLPNSARSLTKGLRCRVVNSLAAERAWGRPTLKTYSYESLIVRLFLTLEKALPMRSGCAFLPLRFS